MARLFNIYFTYGEALHNAIVSVRPNSLFTEYILGNLEEELKNALPSNVVMATDTELRFQNSTGRHPAALMNAIIKSISAHILLSGDAVNGA